jgi:hypothetical protein
MSVSNPTKIKFFSTGSWYDLRADSVSVRQDVALATYQIPTGSSPYTVDNMGASNRRWVVRGTFEVSGVDQTYTQENGFVNPTLLYDLCKNTGSKMFYDAGWAVGSAVVEIENWNGERDTSTAKSSYQVGYRLKYTLSLKETA